MLKAGTVINNKYKIAEVIGKGGQNFVYRGYDYREKFFDRKDFAIKEMRWSRDIKSDMVSIDFFRQEVELLSNINHPFIPKIIEIFLEEGNLYLVQEFIEGKTLHEMLKGDLRVNPKKAVEIALKIADILEFLHSQNPPVYYRDLKPANIIIKSNEVYLIDFSGCYIPGIGLGEGVAIRTKGYCPPEAYTTTTADASFDVYTLGTLLYRMVTGFNVGKYTSPVPPLKAGKDKLPKILVDVVNKAIRKNKYARYHSIWEMKIALERVYKQLRVVKVDKAPLKEKSIKNIRTIPCKVPFYFYIYNFIRGIFLLFLDFLVLAMFPVIFLKSILSQVIDLEIKDFPWIICLMAFGVFVIHVFFRHWLDLSKGVADFNYFLHKPLIKNLPFGLISILVVFELIMLLYIFLQLRSY